MSHRWLVTLALFVVSAPAGAGPLQIQTARRTVITASELADPAVELAPALARALSGARLDRARLRYASRAGDTAFVKTRDALIALAPDGAVRWSRPTTSAGSIAALPGRVLDGWIDRASHRFGVVEIDPRDGGARASIVLGPTGGWYDRARVDVAPDGPSDALVSARFAT